MLAAIREIYKAKASQIVPGLLRSLDQVINLCGRDLDSPDCAAVLFIFRHSDTVKLNLLGASIPTGEIESFLFTLDKVSQLRSDVTASFFPVLYLYQYQHTGYKSPSIWMSEEIDEVQ